MRKRFEQQLKIGLIPISDVKINLKTRHQLGPILLGLQYLFTNEELSEKAFELLEAKVIGDKKETGRLGMSLWEILVLGTVRLSLGIDYDFLLDHANEHQTLRSILGVGRSDFTQEKEYKYQTVLDNVRLLDEETIKEINDLVIQAGHQIIKKKEGEEDFKIQLKVDSYVVETHVHFPTDINLTWDCGRKCLDVIRLLQKELSKQEIELPGWREEKDWRRKLKNQHYTTSEIHRKKGKNYQPRLVKSVKEYIKICKKILEKSESTIDDLSQGELEGLSGIKLIGLLEMLRYYVQLLKKHIELMGRRILKGEKIPHEEKMFSIFEQHTRWINKGKMHKKVELGLPVLIATDQHQFILHHEVMETQTDVELAQPVGMEIQQKYGLSKDDSMRYTLSSISFDRGFYSQPAKKELEKHYEEVVMPKPGKKSRKQLEEETQPNFVALKRAHSTVEANINCLENHGVGRCKDKGINGFKRYVAFGVLSYNLQHLGKLLIEQQKATELKELKKKKKDLIRV